MMDSIESFGDQDSHDAHADGDGAVTVFASNIAAEALAEVDSIESAIEVLGKMYGDDLVVL